MTPKVPEAEPLQPPAEPAGGTTRDFHEHTPLDGDAKPDPEADPRETTRPVREREPLGK